MKLIINTISSEKITPDKLMHRGNWRFTTGYIDKDSRLHTTWKSEPVKNPTEGDMAEQAQKFLDETGDIHPYLERHEVSRESVHTIYMSFGS